MDLSPWQFAATVVGSGGASSIVTAFLNWRTQQSKDATIAKSAVAEAAEKLVTAALASAGEQITRLEEEVEKLRTELAETREQHDFDMAALRTRHNRCEQETAELKAQIEDLLRQPVAGYQTIRRVNPK